MKQFGLNKSCKLCSRTAIEQLFAPGGGKSALAYPLRAVWRKKQTPAENAESSENTSLMGEATAMSAGISKILISVPKKRLRRAVDRVRIRRLVREAYRLQRPAHEKDSDGDREIAFIYVGNSVHSFRSISAAMQRLLPKIFNRKA